MYLADDIFGNIVYADQYDGKTPCFCHDCHKAVYHRGGPPPHYKKCDHFAHKSNSQCKYIRDKDYMSEWHRKMQSFFKNNIEYTFTDQVTGEKHIADVYLPDFNMVIEFQHSPITPGEFLKRTKFHLDNGRRILWIFDGTKEFQHMDNRNLTIDLLEEESEEYRDETFTWNSKQLKALLHYNREKIADVYNDYSRFSICIDTGEGDGIVRRIVKEREDYHVITFSKTPIRMAEGMDVDQFFACDQYIVKQILTAIDYSAKIQQIKTAPQPTVLAIPNIQRRGYTGPLERQLLKPQSSRRSAQSTNRRYSNRKNRSKRTR